MREEGDNGGWLMYIDGRATGHAQHSCQALCHMKQNCIMDKGSQTGCHDNIFMENGTGLI